MLSIHLVAFPEILSHILSHFLFGYSLDSEVTNFSSSFLQLFSYAFLSYVLPLQFVLFHFSCHTFMKLNICRGYPKNYPKNFVHYRIHLFLIIHFVLGHTILLTSLMQTNAFLPNLYLPHYLPILTISSRLRDILR